MDPEAVNNEIHISDDDREDAIAAAALADWLVTAARHADDRYAVTTLPGGWRHRELGERGWRQPAVGDIHVVNVSEEAGNRVATAAGVLADADTYHLPADSIRGIRVDNVFNFEPGEYDQETFDAVLRQFESNPSGEVAFTVQSTPPAAAPLWVADGRQIPIAVAPITIPRYGDRVFRRGERLVGSDVRGHYVVASRFMNDIRPTTYIELVATASDATTSVFVMWGFLSLEFQIEQASTESQIFADGFLLNQERQRQRYSDFVTSGPLRRQMYGPNIVQPATRAPAVDWSLETTEFEAEPIHINVRGAQTRRIPSSAPTDEAEFYNPELGVPLPTRPPLNYKRKRNIG